MIACPFCGSENTEGSDICDDCQHSLTDLSIPRPATAVERGLLKDRVSALAPKSPTTVPPDAPIGEVLKQMTAESIGCVMIVSDGRLQGIFSERDALLRLNAEASQFFDRPISTVMTPDPITVDSKDRIAFALHNMHVGGYRHLPIVSNKGSLTGIISVRDILRYLAEKMSASESA
jgi:CBS domain-containing protein